MATFLRSAWFGAVPALLLVAGCGFFSIDDPKVDEGDDDGSGATGGSALGGSGGSSSGAGGAGTGGSAAGTGSGGTSGSASGGGGATGGSGGSAGSAGSSGGTGGAAGAASGGSAGSAGEGAGGTAGTSAAAGASGSGGEGGSGGSTPAGCASRQGELHAGHCYKAFTTPASFAEARAACEELGAHLATISSDGVAQAEFDAENSFVWGLVDNGEVWIGLTDGRGDMENGDGSASAWITGEGIALDNWSDGEPNNYQKDCPNGGPTNACWEHCGLIAPDRNGQWNDDVCGYAKQYVCEWDSE
jgi:hypothetical protein